MAYSSPETVEDEYLTNHDLSARYKVPLETIRKWRATGYGPPAARLGRHVRYRRSDVLRWEEQRAGREIAPRRGTRRRGGRLVQRTQPT